MCLLCSAFLCVCGDISFNRQILYISYTVPFPLQFYEVVKDDFPRLAAKSLPTPTPMTSDLFPPPDTPLENALGTGFGMPFHLKHTPAEEDELSWSLRLNPFSDTAASQGSRERGQGGREGGQRGREGDQGGREGGQGGREGGQEGGEEGGQGARGVVMERNEPVLQRAMMTAVEMPPPAQLLSAHVEDGRWKEEEEEWEDKVVDEQLDRAEEEGNEEGDSARERVHAELESLSLASRKFLKVSHLHYVYGACNVQ